MDKCNKCEWAKKYEELEQRYNAEVSELKVKLAKANTSLDDLSNKFYSFEHELQEHKKRLREIEEEEDYRRWKNE